MAQRTVREAEAWLEANVEQLNPVMYQRYSQQVAAAKAQHAAKALEEVRAEVEHFTAEQHEVLTDGCAIRDEYEALAAEARSGQLSAQEYRERLEKLDGEFNVDLKKAAARLSSRMGVVEQIEEDPVGWTDSLYERMPTLTKPSFDF